jgi:hypothetical protein
LALVGGLATLPSSLGQFLMRAFLCHFVPSCPGQGTGRTSSCFVLID